MKRMIVTIFVAGFSSVLFSQISAYEYLYKTPVLPGDLCLSDASHQDSFIKEVLNLSDSIKTDIQRRSNAATEYLENHKEEMQAGIMTNVGFSKGDFHGTKNGKGLTDIEKRELAERMMQIRANRSTGEVLNLKSMSTEEKQALAQLFGAGQVTTSQANPKQNLAEQNNNSTTARLLSEQNTLRQNISFQENKFRQMYEVLDAEAEADKRITENKLKALYEELRSINDGEGSKKTDIEHSYSVKKQIQVIQEQFCEKYSARMTNFLQQCKDSIEKSLPDYDRVEEIQYEVVATQTGTDIMKAGRGTYSLRAVEQYLYYLARAFRYKLYRIENKI